MTRWAVVTLFRGERRQLLQWCNLHLGAGADRVYVVLDRPEPGFQESLPAHPQVVWETIDQSTWERYYSAGRGNVERRQVDAVRWIAHRAAADGQEWLAFVDADEVLEVRRPLAELADRYPDAAAFTVPPTEMWFGEGEDRSDPFGARIAIRAGARGVPWERALGWRAQYLRHGMLGHDIGKTVYRLPLASGLFSVHTPLQGRLLAGAVTLTEDDARLRHYDAGCLATWNAKWAARLQGHTTTAGLAPHRRAQQALFAVELTRSPEQQAAFFHRFFSLDATALGVLDPAGVVERIAPLPVAGPLPVGPAAASGPVRLPDRSKRVDVQVAMVCDRNFVRPTFATMISVLSRLDPARTARFVVLGDRLRPDDEVFLRSLEDTRPGVEVRVHDVTADLDRDVSTKGHQRARATYGRVYLVDHLPEQRTLYLDGDILATRDISELFELDMGDACLAGVTDSAALRLIADPFAGVPTEQGMRLRGITGGDPSDYLNAGVLVLDLDHPDFRELALQARAHVAHEGRALAQHDQDAINLAFRGRKLRLPHTYNYMTQFYTSARCLDDDLIGVKYGAADASLIHFSGRVKPWLSREDEFYNGLYRALVLRAEEALAVSGGFYFSRGAGTVRDARGWSEALTPTLAPPAETIIAGEADVVLIDVTDERLHLALRPASYEHLATSELSLVLRDAAGVLFHTPMSALGPQQTHLAARVRHGVRAVPIDLPAVLAGRGGVARGVELLIVPTTAVGMPDAGFVRSIALIDLLAAGASATSELLPDTGIVGRVEEVRDGWLHGWYRTSSAEAVSLHLGTELVAWRRSAEQDDGRRPFKFRLRHLLALGYGSAEDEITVRVAGTNLPLAGPRLTVARARAEMAPARDATSEPALVRPVVNALLARATKRLRAGRG